MRCETVIATLDMAQTATQMSKTSSLAGATRRDALAAGAMAAG
jgi:hypothetical protein